MEAKKLLEDIRDIASAVSNHAEDHQVSDDCATICQMIEDFLSDNSQEQRGVAVATYGMFANRKTMTTQEARIILHWRCKHDYSFSSIGMTARAIWGDEWCDEFTGGREGNGRTGEVLLCRAEETLGLEVCDSDDMVWIEGICNKCKYVGVYLTPKKDTAKECAGCGEMSVFIPANAKDQRERDSITKYQMTMTTKNTKSQDGDAVSSLSSSDMFGDDCSEIVIKLQMVAYKDDKEAFEKHLMGKLQTMLEDGENTFYPHKLVSVKYDVELRRVKLSPNSKKACSVLHLTLKKQ